MASRRELKGEFWGASNVLFLDLCLYTQIYSFYDNSLSRYLGFIQFSFCVKFQ